MMFPLEEEKSFILKRVSYIIIIHLNRLIEEELHEMSFMLNALYQSHNTEIVFHVLDRIDRRVMLMDLSSGRC